MVAYTEEFKKEVTRVSRNLLALQLAKAGYLFKGTNPTVAELKQLLDLLVLKTPAES